MTQNSTLHGALVFVGKPNTALNQFSRVAVKALAARGHPVERHSLLGEHQARIATERYGLKLRMVTTDGTDAEACRLVLTLTPADPETTDPQKAEVLLAAVLCRTAELADIEHVEWLKNDTHLPLDKFRDAFGLVGPRRVIHPKFAAALAAQAEADRAKQEHDAEDKSIRVNLEKGLAKVFRKSEVEAVEGEPDAMSNATAWVMTGTTALISGPAGLALAAANLRRGGDVRMNLQIMALSALFVTVLGDGAFAATLPDLPPLDLTTIQSLTALLR